MIWPVDNREGQAHVAVELPAAPHRVRENLGHVTARATRALGHAGVVPDLVLDVVYDRVVALLRRPTGVEEPDLIKTRDLGRPDLLALCVVQVVKQVVNVLVVWQDLHRAVIQIETVNAHPVEHAVHVGDGVA